MRFRVPSTSIASTPGDTPPGSTPVFESEIDYTSNSLIETPCPGKSKDKNNIIPNTKSTTRSMAVSAIISETPRGSTILVPATGPRTASERRLRTTLQSLREKLETSRQMINNLRTRNDIYKVDHDAMAVKLQEAETKGAMAEMEVSGGGMSEVTGVKLVGIVFGLALLGFWWWNWYNSPEMEYVRRRQREVYGL